MSSESPFCQTLSSEIWRIYFTWFWVLHQIFSSLGIQFVEHDRLGTECFPNSSCFLSLHKFNFIFTYPLRDWIPAIQVDVVFVWICQLKNVIELQSHGRHHSTRRWDGYGSQDQGTFKMLLYFHLACIPIRTQLLELRQCSRRLGGGP